MINIDKVEWLLFKSSLSAYKIAKESGISLVNVRNYQTKKRQLKNMQLWMAKRLSEYAEKI